MDRRDFLGVLTAMGAEAVCGPAVAASDAYERAVATVSGPLQRSPRDRELVRFATLAANSHNTQPWLFTLGETRIVIVPDFSRRCRAVDPDDLFASLGCATENLVQAASALGWRATPVFDGKRIVIELETAPPVNPPWLDAITARQCSRTPYDGKEVPDDGKEVPAQMVRHLEEAAGGEGISVLMMTDKDGPSHIVDYVLQGNYAQMRDRAFMQELIGWIRLSAADALATMDGLFSGSSGDQSLRSWIARPLLRLFFTERGENERYRAQIEGVAIIVSVMNDRAHWVAAGCACQRFGLPLRRSD